MLKEKAATARGNLERAEETARDLETLKKQAREHPAPDAETIQKLEGNRTRAGQARADLEAAAITVMLSPEPGAAVPRLAIDGAPAVEARPAAEETALRRLVRRRAEIAIPGWGRVELARGSDARSLDQIESDLIELDRQFAEGLAPFGVGAGDPTGLDQLRRLAAEKAVRDPELKRKQEEVHRLAPDGLDPLREEAARLEKLLSASDADPGSSRLNENLPAAVDDLEQLAGQLKKDIEDNEKKAGATEGLIAEAEREIDGPSDADSTPVKRRGKADKSKSVVQGLRRQEADAKEARASFDAAAVIHREELGRMLTAEQIEVAIRRAEEALGARAVSLKGQG